MRLYLIATGLILTLFTQIAFSEDTLSTSFFYEINPHIQDLIEHVHHENFEKALEISEIVIQLYPDHPIGYFFKAAVYDTIIRDYSDYRYYPLFDSAVNTAIRVGSIIEKREIDNGLEADIWVRFFLGAAYGFRGIHNFFKSEWFSAFRDGVRGVSQLDLCLELNPKMYDAYYGLGNYYYWTSAKSRMLWFLPFISDERDKGIEHLTNSVQNGFYTNKEAQYALLRIYNNEKLFDKTIILADVLAKEYPEDIFCLYQKLLALLSLKKWAEADTVSQRILDLYASCNLHCFEKISEISFLKVQANEQLNNKQSVQDTLQFIMKEKKRRELQESITKTAKKYIKKIKKINAKLR